ncbi:uncharacterized protein [Parasteatoda tepidariorum]|uniref:uncharacterized protein isoform X1 n=2 Tax=Parasteatoda tepidariorum TaxID=114398 RepID=UPI001C725157|nr:uncharacterized protein LOC107448253 [Parasteatoda tepidariorum]
MMSLMKIVFLLVLVQVISCLTYDELAKDECFKKVYLCGDYRMSVTGGTGRLATEPHRFSEICRKHKEFIACVEQAADFCNEKFTNVSRMILDNRRSLKLFCTDFEWKRNYFSSAKCINENEKKVAEECVKEEEEYVDDRPYWCLIPEPCEALERVFYCTIRKMKQRCGSVAAEVHRRMHILKIENRDIVCEIRLRNSLYCRYQRRRPSQSETIKRIGSLSVALSKAINNVFEAALVDTMDNFALLMNEENLSNLFESDEYQLRKYIFKQEIDDKFGPFFKKCKLPKGELSPKPDLSARGFSLLFGNIKKVLSEASTEIYKLGSNFYENILKPCETEIIMLASCLDNLSESRLIKTLNLEISQELNAELKSLQDYILDLLELLSCNEDFLVKSISEDGALISWENMDSFPLQTLSCEWKDENAKKIFQCSFKLKPSDPAPEGMQPESTVESEIVNEFLKPFTLGTSLYTEFGSGIEADFTLASEQGIAADFSPKDTPTSEVDSHAKGEQLVLPKSLDLINENTQPGVTESLIKNENVNESQKSFVLESSLLIDSGSGMVDDFVEIANEQGTSLDSFTTDTSTSEVDYFDIHRSGELMDLPEEIVTEEVSEEELGDIKLSGENNQNVKELHKGDHEHSSGETYILVDPPYSPDESVSYLVVDQTSNTDESYLDSLERPPSHVTAESSSVEIYNEERENLELQLRKIIGALNERFADVEGKIFDSKKGTKSYSKKRQIKIPQFYHPYNINKSFQSELEHLLKEKMNEYIEMYSIYSQPPSNIKSKRPTVRTKRGVANERKNSKLDKSFDVESSNESTRTNSKFLNFKAEL